MQKDYGSQITPNAETGSEPEAGQEASKNFIKKSPKKKLFVLVVGALLLVLLAGWVWMVHDEASIARQDERKEQPGQQSAFVQVASYRECVEAGYEVTKGEPGYCTSPDGLVFIEGLDDPYGINDNSEKESNLAIAASGQQSVQIQFGDDLTYDMYAQVTNLTYGGDLSVTVNVLTKNIDVATCSLSVVRIPDNPTVPISELTITPSAKQKMTFVDGNSTVSVECPIKAGGLITAKKEIRVGDGLPERCADFSFITPIASSAISASDLKAGMVGIWDGCADNPWWPTYYMTITFNPDGTFNAVSEEKLDNVTFGGGLYYYNTSGSDPLKVFDIATFQDGVGQGFLDVIEPKSAPEQPYVGGVERGDIRNVKLNGDVLTLDFYHKSQYGPVRLELKRR